MIKTMILLLTVILSLTITAQNRKIIFEHNKPWKDITKKAKDENKIIFIDCYTTWCGPCKVISKTVFTQDKVADFFNEKFICAKIDMEKGEGPKLAKQFGIRAYPTLLYVNSDSEIVHLTVGSVNAETLLEQANIALDDKNNFKALKTKYQNGERDGEFMYKYMNILKDSYNPNLNKVYNDYFNKIKEEDYTSKINWKIINEFEENINSKMMNYLLKNKEKFIENHGSGEVEDKIYNVFQLDFFTVFRTRTLNEEKYNNFKKEYLTKHSYNRINEIAKAGDLIFHQYFSKNWDKYASTAVEFIETYKIEVPRTLNQIAWNIYENISDKAILKKALKWSKKTNEIVESPSYLDTYSALNYKLGNLDEAIKIEEKAIKIAKSKGEDVKSYEKFIEKIKEVKANKK